MSGAEPSALERARGVAAREKEAYEGDSDRPVGSFLAIMGVYLAGVGGLGVLVRRRGRVLPERVGLADLALITVATHKLSRLLAKDPVTSPLRAPFTTFAGTSGPAELAEKVRGSGFRRAMGALVTCPFCLAVWVATGLAFSLVFAPRTTRFAASILAVVAGADVLHLAYGALEQKTQA
ncbi:MAG TPA: DUF1360 domain-containing protein [Acidimicrobiales bacterium]|nr:DUF1360 domain-containing protein [Acidimicrobiales bacterium]